MEPNNVDYEIEYTISVPGKLVYQAVSALLRKYGCKEDARKKLTQVVLEGLEESSSLSLSNHLSSSLSGSHLSQAEISYRD